MSQGNYYLLNILLNLMLSYSLKKNNKLNNLIFVFFQSAFELYGADFMLGEDLSPWLIEINSSPSMCRNTRATVKLVDMVMEDTIKGKDDCF